MLPALLVVWGFIVNVQRMQAILIKYHVHLAQPLLNDMATQHAADAEHDKACREWRPRCMQH